MERSSSVRIPRALAAGQWLGLLAFGATLAGLHASIDLRRYQNADLYYLPALYADLVSWGGRLSEWKLPPAPYFFPDMALYFPVQALLRNYSLTFVVAGALQAVLWLAGWLLVVRALGLPRERRPLIYGLTALAIAALLWLPGPGQALPFLLTTHFGVVLVTPYALALAIVLLRQAPAFKIKLATAAGLLLLSFLLAASDTLALIQLILPLIIGVALVGIASRDRFRASLAVVACLAVGAAAGQEVARRAIASDSTVRYTTLRLARVAASAQALRHWALTVTQANPAVTALFFLALLLHIIAFAAWLLRPAAARTGGAAAALVSLFVLLSVLLTPPAVLASGDPFTPRYLLPLFFFPLAALPVALTNLPRWQARSAGPVAQWGTVAAAAGLIVFSLWRLGAGAGLARYADYYPEWVRCVDTAAADRNLAVGLADYWDAKYFSVLSRQGVKLLQVAPNMEPFPWISNVRWYKRWLPEFVVARVDSRGGLYVSESETTARLGQPAERLACGDHVVLVYNRQRDRAFHTYLRDRLP